MDVIRDNAPWANFGTSLGSGIGEGLQNLARLKLNDLMQKKQARSMVSGLQSLGYDQQEASNLANLMAVNPQLGHDIVRTKLQEPNQQAFMGALSQIMGIPQTQNGQLLQQMESPQLSQQEAQIGAPALSQQMTQMRPMEAKKTPREQVEAVQAAQRASNIPVSVSPKDIQESIGETQRAPMGMMGAQTAQQKPSFFGKGGITANQAMQLANLATQQRTLANKEAMEQQKLELAQQKAQEMKEYHGERIDIQRERIGLQGKELTKEVKKEWREFLDKSAKRASAARELRPIHKEILNLARKGDYRSPVATEILKKLKIESFGRNAQTELLDKLANQIVAKGAEGFGSQATQFIEQVLQKANPSILLNPESNAAIAKMSLAQDDYEEKYEDVSREYYNKNKDSILPPDSDSAVEEILAPDREKRNKIFEDAAKFAMLSAEQGTSDDSWYKDQKYPIGTEALGDDGKRYRKSGTMQNPKLVLA